MKRIVVAALVVFMLFISVFSASAKGVFVTDSGNLLSDEQERELQTVLENQSKKCSMDIVAVTTDSLNGLTPRLFTENFYTSNGYGEDGVIIMISVDEVNPKNREVYIASTGTASEKIDGEKIDMILDRIVPELKSGQYCDAIETYAVVCGEYLIDVKDYTDLLLIGGICLVVGFGIALIIVLGMKSKHKSVRFESDADNYLKSGSLDIHEARDIFLYFHITRVPKPKDNNKTLSGKGGGSFKGGGRSF